jgi:hypothetical protein
MLPSQASELKQQGALEAARDPDAPVSAEDAKKVVVAEAKKSGVAAAQFDPDATTEEKVAQLNAVSLYCAVVPLPQSFESH